MKQDEKRSLLKQKVFDSAFERINQDGLTGLRARDIAKDAGCSLGSLYNAYQDLDDLILHVNSRVLEMLKEDISTSVVEDQDAEAALVNLAVNYMNFAYAHYNLWTSLFGHTMQDNAPIPDWYTEQTNATFLTLIAPLLKLRPELDEAQAFILVRTLFSAVHGIITINLQERFISIPKDMLKLQLVEFVQTYAKGLQNKA
ncbi:MAG: TetR/AcrR family transcriptional regulator [Lentilitoribacter sp.]